MKNYLGFYAGKKVLITGGLGFIGSNLAWRLVEGKNTQVIIVDAMVPDQGGNLYNIHGIESRLKINISDISNTSCINHLVKDVDIIFNLAAQKSHIDSMNNPHVDLQINCSAHLSLLEACRKNNLGVKIVYTSTRQIYGSPGYLPVDEKHPLNPKDINSINKMACEKYHMLYHDVYGMNIGVLRLTNTYGPRQLMKHHRQGFIGWFIRKAIDGEEIQIFGDGKQLRDLNFVDDVVDALLLAGVSDETKGEIFNLGSRNPINLLELTEMLIQITGKGSYKLVPFPGELRAIDIGDYVADCSKAESKLGWVTKTTLGDGLYQTVEFYRAHKDIYWS